MVKVIPTEEMYQEWLMHPVTQVYRQFLGESRKVLMEQWEAGAFQVDGDPLKIAIANAGALSECRKLKELAELTYEQFSESFDDEEYVRATPAGDRSAG